MLPVASPPNRSPRRARIDPPAGATDCHAHVFAPPAAYPWSPKRPFDPAPETGVDAYLGMLDAVGLSRGVVVASSVYGTDNRSLLAALDAGTGRLRGIAMVRPDASAAELRSLHAAGVRGLRISLTFRSVMTPSDLEAMAPRLSELGWHGQFLLDPAHLVDLDGLIRRLPIPVVVDHIARMLPAHGADHPGFLALLRLVGSGKAWVKLSVPYLGEAHGPPFPWATGLARRLVAANPERMLWGTDWPHLMAPRMPDDGDLADWLAEVADDAALRRRILVDNPARLFGFGG
jgi:predicted TIM-barrel fold metal-dependent hydrolase